MTGTGKREIIVEIERIRTIRKRATTTLRHCEECGSEADFVEMRTAAGLFETHENDLRRFTEINGVHVLADAIVCVPSLLKVFHSTRTDSRRLLASGEDGPSDSTSGE